LPCCRAAVLAGLYHILPITYSPAIKANCHGRFTVAELRGEPDDAWLV